MNFVIIRTEKGDAIQHRVDGRIVSEKEFEDRFTFRMLIGRYNSSYTYRSRRGNYVHSCCVDTF